MLAGWVYKAKHAIYNKSDAYIALADSTGNMIWQRAYPGPQILAQNYFLSTVKDDKDIITAGRIFNGTSRQDVNADLWLMRLDSNGCLRPGYCPTISNPEHVLPERDYAVFPNPSPDGVIQLEGPSDFHQERTVKVFNSQGKLLQQHSWQDSPDLELDLAALPRGFYLLEVWQSHHRVASQRLMLTHQR